MGSLLDVIKRFLQVFVFWQVVAPWEQALCVRLGRSVRLWSGGLHLKIPFLDVIYLQSVRMRVSPLGRQTITLSGSIAYSIEDIGRLYETLHHAEDTISSLARVAIAQYVSTHELCACEPTHIVAHLMQELNYERYGLGGVEVYLTDFAVVRTFRMIGDFTTGNATPLSTDRPHGQENNTAPYGYY